ncbi:unnamed protein product, partial [Didymodactylos carnosus]
MSPYLGTLTEDGLDLKCVLPVVQDSDSRIQFA